MSNPTKLPQLSGDRLFITDGGLETTLIFHQGLDLPLFAAFDLLKSDEGKEAIREYFAPYVQIANETGAGLVLDTATWRANPDWAEQLGYSPEELDEAEDLDDGNPAEYVELHRPLSNLCVLGGCCGTDARHIGEIARTWQAQ